LTRTKTRLATRGVASADITTTSAFGDVLTRTGQAIDPAFVARLNGIPPGGP